jgi:phage-related protein
MPDVAAGVSELRVRGEDGSYRAFYYTASARGLLCFTFVKKTQRTPPLEMDLGRRRLRELLNG